MFIRSPFHRQLCQYTENKFMNRLCSRYYPTVTHANWIFLFTDKTMAEHECVTNVIRHLLMASTLLS